MWQHHILAPQDISRHTPGWRAIARSQRPRTMNKGLKICLNILNNVLLVPMSSVIHGRSRLRGMDVLEGVIKSFENCRCEASTSRHLETLHGKAKYPQEGWKVADGQGCASSQLLRCSLAASDQCNELVFAFCELNTLKQITEIIEVREVHEKYWNPWNLRSNKAAQLFLVDADDETTGSPAAARGMAGLFRRNAVAKCCRLCRLRTVLTF